MALLNHWNDYYRSIPHGSESEISKFIFDNNANLRIGRCLCLGSGLGQNARYLASLGHNVTAVDFSDQAIFASKEEANLAGLKITHHLENIDHYAIPWERYDTIVCCRLTIFTVKYPKLLRSIKYGLKSGGTLLLEGYTINHQENEHSFLYSWFYGIDPDSTKEVLKDLCIKTQQINDREICEYGQSSLQNEFNFEYFQLIAKKS